VCIIIAMLFRVEAICYLISLPLCLLLIKNLSWKYRLAKMLNAYSIAITACVAIALAFLLNDDLRMQHFGRLQEVFSLNLYQEFTNNLMEKAQIMSGQVLGKYLEDFALTGLLLTFLYAMIAKTISATGLFATIFAGFTLKNGGHNIDPKTYLVLKTTAIVALISMALIIIKVFVLSGRYVAGLSWVLLVLGAFYFANLLNIKDKKIALIASLVVIALCLGFVKNILPKRLGYNYMQEAATWLKQHNSEQAPVFYNETRMRYYMAEPFVGVWEDNGELVSDAIENKTINQYTFLVVAQSSKRPEDNALISKQLTNHSEVKRFNSFKAKNSIVIYRKNTH
jgi:hypothetical protein